MKINQKTAKSISYGTTRNLQNVKYIVIHYTGNNGDTAKNNADYFATSNTRQAGAHFFVDKAGEIWASVPMKYTAWAVGGLYTKSAGAASYYEKCTNANSVSIELCDCLKEVGWKQMLAVRGLVKHIQKQCPGAQTIVRHWDVNGKSCPAPMTGTDNKMWKHLKTKILYNYQFKAKVTKKACIRSSKGVKPGNKTGTKKKGDIVYISKVSGSWGRLKKKSKTGKWRWISLKKVAEL
ncbi:MAG: N-acetylmuramoyl-L-alanine amidase [Lachnospiraceae bacterium]|nr:N-acetylmuramoyl-L-alanine amidase [Lachnospiraceae bacterium]